MTEQERLDLYTSIVPNRRQLLIQEMKNNEKMCYDIEESILEGLFSDCGDTEYESIKKYYYEIVKQTHDVKKGE